MQLDIIIPKIKIVIPIAKASKELNNKLSEFEQLVNNKL